MERVAVSLSQDASFADHARILPEVYRNVVGSTEFLVKWRNVSYLMSGLSSKSVKLVEDCWNKWREKRPEIRYGAHRLRELRRIFLN